MAMARLCCLTDGIPNPQSTLARTVRITPWMIASGVSLGQNRESNNRRVCPAAVFARVGEGTHGSRLDFTDNGTITNCVFST
jgi:hypothetical protein